VDPPNRYRAIHPQFPLNPPTWDREIMNDCNQPPDGASLMVPRVREDARVDGESLPITPLRLVLRPNGPVVELTRSEMILGRHSEADVRLPLPDVSRRHCRFVYSEGAWQLFDLDSLNGVFVNGCRVQHATLQHGDTVTMGGFVFAVEIDGGAKHASAPVFESAQGNGAADQSAAPLPLPSPGTDLPRRKAS